MRQEIGLDILGGKPKAIYQEGCAWHLLAEQRLCRHACSQAVAVAECGTSRRRRDYPRRLNKVHIGDERTLLGVKNSASLTDETFA